MPRPDTLFFGFEGKMTKEQKIYVDSIFDNQLTIVNARSGTGKTTLAVAAAKLLKKELVYIFAPVQEKTLGYRPGNTKEKESDYIVPLRDALLEINEDVNKAIFNPDDPVAMKKGEAWCFPMSHTFARGTNIKNKTVIIDEAQNWTKSELKKVLTRIHDSCTVIIIGHTGQIDLPNPAQSGFLPYIKHFKDKEYCKVVELNWNFRGRLANDADELE